MKFRRLWLAGLALAGMMTHAAAQYAPANWIFDSSGNLKVRYGASQIELGNVSSGALSITLSSLLTTGNITSSVAPGITQFWSGENNLTALDFNVTAASATMPEASALFRMTSATGYNAADPIGGAYKIALGVEAIGNDGTGAIYGLNVVNTIAASTTGEGLVTQSGVEIDLNNQRGDYAPPGKTSTWLALTGINAYPSTAYLYITSFDATTYASHYGIWFLGATTIKDYTILDESSSSVSYQVVGTHTAGISTQSCTCSFQFIGNNFEILNTGEILLQGTSGVLLSVGAGSTGPTTSPSSILFDGTYSSVPGANPKINLFGGFGFGVAAGELDYIVPSGAKHAFWVNSAEVVTIGAEGATAVAATESALTSGIFDQLSVTLTVAPASASRVTYIASQALAQATASNLAAATIIGGQFGANVSGGGGNLVELIGDQLSATWSSSGTLTTMIGVTAQASNTSVGTVTSMVGDQTALTTASGSTTTSAVGVAAQLINDGAIGTYYALSANVANAGSIGTYAGLYIAPRTGTGTVGTEYAIYSNSTAPSVFAGPIQFATAMTGSGTQTFTNSPCASLTTEEWIPVQVSGLTGTYYVAACH